jgi:hypothetical protein
MQLASSPRQGPAPSVTPTFWTGGDTYLLGIIRSSIAWAAVHVGVDSLENTGNPPRLGVCLPSQLGSVCARTREFVSQCLLLLPDALKRWKICSMASAETNGHLPIWPLTMHNDPQELTSATEVLDRYSLRAGRLVRFRFFLVHHCHVQRQRWTCLPSNEYQLCHSLGRWPKMA